MTIIYKIVPADLWTEIQASGRLDGAPVDIADGFIHFSTAAQVRETAARHFSGQDGLVLVAVEADRLAHALKWERSRGGDLFPHLYGPLMLDDVLCASSLELHPEGHRGFPDERP